MLFMFMQHTLSLKHKYNISYIYLNVCECQEMWSFKCIQTFQIKRHIKIVQNYWRIQGPCNKNIRIDGKYCSIDYMKNCKNILQKYEMLIFNKKTLEHTNHFIFCFSSHHNKVNEDKNSIKCLQNKSNCETKSRKHFDLSARQTILCLTPSVLLDVKMLINRRNGFLYKEEVFFTYFFCLFALNINTYFLFFWKHRESDAWFINAIE